MSKFKVPLFWPNVFKDEWLKELSKVFDTRWLGEGPQTKKFESEFGKKFGYDHCLSVNSGSAALELAYDLIGIKEGDEVLTTVLTCSATNIPLLRRKAKITFVDIDKETLTMDFNDFRNKMSGNIKAIVTVNLGGIECDSRIYELAKRNNIPVIVDACQSLGIPEKHGDYVVYSFQAIKHFTCADGGMLIIRNEEDYIRAKKLRWFGIDREKKSYHDWRSMISEREICMDVEEPGYKFHMNDIAATMGIVGLRHSDEALKHRKKIASMYDTLNSDKIKTVAGGSYWLFGLLVNNRYELMKRLRANGIECDPSHLRNDIFTAFGGKRLELKNMNYIESRYMYIPIHTNVSMSDVKYVCGMIKVIGDGLS